MLNNDPIFLAEFPVLETPKAELALYLFERMAAAKKNVLFFANTNFIVQCRPILQRMLNVNILIVNDGLGMDIAALMLYQHQFQSNLNGTDFIPFFFRLSPKVLRIFLVGGKQEVINKAAYFLVHKLSQDVVGSCDGYDGICNHPDLVNVINASNAEVVLVAMGNPKQELWILDHYELLDAKLISGVGALFDFWAGDKPRAPDLIQKLRMEWLYRLCLEPRRLYKRYTIDVVKFLVLCFRYRKKTIQQVDRS